ncbi:hypothetical protein HanPSC8_Chr10g0415631 [Helianthus annuus]|nr:hypothetical protein HanPSC8_Chr10g0415631 [Helianthus annuus]
MRKLPITTECYTSIKFVSHRQESAMEQHGLGRGVLVVMMCHTPISTCFTGGPGGGLP